MGLSTIDFSTGALSNLKIGLIISSILITLMIFTAVKLIGIGKRSATVGDSSEEDPNVRLLRIGLSIFLCFTATVLLVCDILVLTGNDSLEGIWEPLRTALLIESLAAAVWAKLNKRTSK